MGGETLLAARPATETKLAALRRSLVKELRRQDAIRSAAVAAAFQAVPRHAFLPDVDPETVYKDVAVPTRWRRGMAVSSSSQPAIMALMLEQLLLEPGHRVLEVGAGTGYNAALIQHLVGEGSAVVTVDIDPEMVGWARERLAAAGYGRVQVVAADGGLGWPAAAPFDRIIVTAGCWQVPEPWVEQLREGGVLVLPLRLNLATVSVALRKAGERLESLSCLPCGFISLQGAFGRRAGGRLPGLPGGRCLTDWPPRRLPRRAMGALLREEPVVVEDERVAAAQEAGAWDFWSFVALQGEPVVTIHLPGGAELWNAWGLCDTRGASACLVEHRDSGRLRTYGEDTARDRLRAHAESWLNHGTPRVHHLAMAVEPSRRRGPLLPRPAGDGAYRFWRAGRLFAVRYGAGTAERCGTSRASCDRP